MDLDWDDLRYFLEVTRTRSFSAAARKLRVAQPTVGRRVAAFEERLGTKLFRRVAAGLELTTTAASLVAYAERMELAAVEAERVASGRDAGVEGSIRVSASEWLATYVLASLATRFRAKHPKVAVDIVVDPRWVNLARSDADIAFRFARFDQQAVMQRRVTRVEFGLYASSEYLARRGEPDFTRGCEGHEVLEMADDVQLLDLPWLRALAPRAQVAMRSNSRLAHAAATAAGGGLACLPRPLAATMPNLRELATPRPPPHRDLWLGVHRDVRSIPRVKAFAQFAVTQMGHTKPHTR